MRWLLALVIAIAACGPSAKEVETARGAQYKTDAARIFAIAEEVTEAQYKLAASDAFKGALITLPKWYTPDGQAESGGAGDTVKVQDGSMLVALLVEVKPIGVDYDTVEVAVTPIVERFRMGVAQHEKLAPDDPSMPGWVQGRADALAVAIHARAKQYAAK